MNQAEDTLWLSELPLDVLKEARKWPTWMCNIIRLVGPLIMFFFLCEVISEHRWTAPLILLLVGYCAHKYVEYQEDLTLVNNELIRRKELAGG